jgi:tRNA-2-methylthio-N6-dimethylallyladenosine synthase
VFRYSPRPSTPAARDEDQVPLETKARRNAEVLASAGRIAAARAARLAGRRVEVLVDGRSKKSAGEVQGRTRCNRVVNFEARDGVAVGDVVGVRITEALPHSLRGAIALLPEEAVCLSR